MSKYGAFSGPYFPVFGLKTEIYWRYTEQISVFITNTWKYRPEKTPHLDTFHVVNIFLFRGMFRDHSSIQAFVKMVQNKQWKSSISFKRGKGRFHVVSMWNTRCVCFFWMRHCYNSSSIDDLTVRTHESNSLVREQDKVARLIVKVAMKGLGRGKKLLQRNIFDLFPDIPTTPDRWSLHSDWMWNTHKSVKWH